MANELRTAPLVNPRTGGRLSGRVYEAVKARLLRGEVPAGARLSVEALRSEFGVSKQPIMEALRMLDSEGLVEIFPQIGCVVSQYSVQEIRDFFHMFAGLEGSVTAVAARRCTPESLAALDATSRRIRALADTADTDARSLGYQVLNREFHEGIHRMADSRIISDTSQRMWDLSDFLINTAGISQPMAALTDTRQDDHDRIRDAIAAKDAETAKAEMERHILATADLLRGLPPAFT